MADSGAKFDNDIPPMSEAEAGSIEMGDNPPVEEVLNPQMDLDEPLPNQTEISFDDQGSMLDEQPGLGVKEREDTLVNTLEEIPKEQRELAADKAQSPPEWFKPYAESQKKLAEHFDWERKNQEMHAQQQAQYNEARNEAYYRSPDYISQVCEANQLDSEDPVHRKMVESELRANYQQQQYENRLKNLESSILLII